MPSYKDFKEDTVVVEIKDHTDDIIFGTTSIGRRDTSTSAIKRNVSAEAIGGFNSILK